MEVSIYTCTSQSCIISQPTSQLSFSAPMQKLILILFFSWKILLYDLVLQHPKGTKLQARWMKLIISSLHRCDLSLGRWISFGQVSLCDSNDWFAWLLLFSPHFSLSNILDMFEKQKQIEVKICIVKIVQQNVEHLWLLQFIVRANDPWKCYVV